MGFFTGFYRSIRSPNRGVSKTQTTDRRPRKHRPQKRRPRKRRLRKCRPRKCCLFFENTADLENADLENTDLENADLENTDLENADLENADLENVAYLVVEKLRPFILDGKNKI